jgi:pimeloyl-ACP methyl ester carboxylesterase
VEEPGGSLPDLRPNALMEDSMFLDIDGNRVFALSFGAGARTLLADGGWISNVEDWIATLAPLSARWRVVVYDHRGAGLTRVPVDRITPEALVDDVFRVMGAMGIERCVLAGFSRGTVTAVRAVLAQPDRFDGLVLMNGCGEVRAPDVPATPRIPPSKWPGETHEDRLRCFIERCTPEPDIVHIRRWGMYILSRATPEAADKLFMMEFDQPIDRARRLPHLSVPTLIVHGEKDPLYRTEHMEYTRSLIRDCELVVMDGSGHLPAMTRPLEVAGHIERFFSARGL